MATLKHAISLGIAARIAKVCSQKLAFSHPPVTLLIGPPLQAGGLLAGVVGGLGGSAGDLVNR